MSKKKSVPIPTHKLSRDGRQLFRTAFGAGQWFMFPKSFLTIMTLQEAVVLSFLINWSGHRKARAERGWFYCTIKRMEKELQLNYRVQRYAMTALDNKGIIETEN
jgi:hypothetical protein